MADVHDLLNDAMAALGILEEIAEISDSLSAKDAIEGIAQLTQLQVQLGTTIALIKGQAIKTLEQPMQVGNVIYYKDRVGKWRPDFQRIAGKVESASLCDPETGEIYDRPNDAVHRAVQLMKALYVSPSTMPKVGGLERIGSSKDDVAEFERTGYEIKTKELDEDD